MSLAMFLYGAPGSSAWEPPGRKSGWGANSSFQAPLSFWVEWLHTPSLVAAHTLPPPKRSSWMVVLSSSSPPTRLRAEKVPWCGCART